MTAPTVAAGPVVEVLSGGSVPAWLAAAVDGTHVPAVWLVPGVRLLVDGQVHEVRLVMNDAWRTEGDEHLISVQTDRSGEEEWAVSFEPDEMIPVAAGGHPASPGGGL